MAEAGVVASCPEAYHDHISQACKALGLQKAFGKTGDMVNDLSGRDWVAKWEAKVVMAVVTKAQTMGATKAKIICLRGGRFCDQELARQPDLVRAIKKEMEDENFRVKVEWMEVSDFCEDYGVADGASSVQQKKGAKAGGKEAKKKNDVKDWQSAESAKGKDAASAGGKGPSKGKDATSAGGKGPSTRKDATSAGGKGFSKGKDSTGRSDEKDAASAGLKGPSKESAKLKERQKGGGQKADQSARHIDDPRCLDSAGNFSVLSLFRWGNAFCSQGLDRHWPQLSNTEELKAWAEKAVAVHNANGYFEIPILRIKDFLPRGKDPASQSGYRADTKSWLVEALPHLEPVLKDKRALPVAAKPKKDAHGNPSPLSSLPWGQELLNYNGSAWPCLRRGCRACCLDRVCETWCRIHQAYGAQILCSGEVCLFLQACSFGPFRNMCTDPKQLCEALHHLGEVADQAKLMGLLHPSLESSEFHCGICSRSFNSANGLEQHREATGHHPLSWSCHMCDRLFATLEACQQHQRATMHTGMGQVLLLECAECLKAFESHQAIDQHQKATGHRGQAALA